jgi:hypothetical protein
MTPIQSDICSQCYSPVPKGALQCPSCGQKIRQSATVQNDRNYSRLGFLQNIGTWGKILIYIGIFFLPAVLLYWGYTYYWSEASKTPYPETRSGLVDKFFYALQHDEQNDFQGCYELIAGSKGAESLVVGDSRDQYISHLRRIRNYLIKYNGENFLDKMTVLKNKQGDPYAVVFDNFIQLTPVMPRVRTLDEERKNYGMQNIIEFPFPNTLSNSLGISGRNDMINSIMSDSSSSQKKPEWLIMVEDYKETEQLDDRHEKLIEMIKKYGDEPGVQSFLANWIPQNERAKHLLLIAEQNLNNPPAEP